MNAALLNKWVQTWGESLDAVRKFVAKTPELKCLGTKFGPIRLYTREEAEAIRTAYRARRCQRLDPASA